MSTWLLILAADFRRRNHKAGIGPETENVCRTAVKDAMLHPEAWVCSPTGRSPRYNVYMGGGPMREYLETHGIASMRLVTPIDPDAPFSTNGETRTFVKTLALYGDTKHSIRLVARWWHAPRGCALLKARLAEAGIVPKSIVVVPVRSADLFWMALEPLKWVWNCRYLFPRSDSS